jgi:choline dehydrogenase-like flavoprotein
VLKKKALTAVLTVAFVFGIGGMATDSFDVHDHETGIAYASPFDDRPVSIGKPATKVAYWRCYWCGKTATTKPSHSGMGAKADPPSPYSNGACVSGHNHGWVFTGGVSPYVSKYEILYCPQCKKIFKKYKTAGGGVSAPQKGCSGNKGGYHHWLITNIIEK